MFLASFRGYQILTRVDTNKIRSAVMIRAKRNSATVEEARLFRTKRDEQVLPLPSDEEQKPFPGLDIRGDLLILFQRCDIFLVDLEDDVARPDPGLRELAA